MISLDLSVHFQNRMQILHLLNADTFNWSNPDHRFLSMSMVLMCADKCFIFKHFENVKKFTTNFYKELQHQVTGLFCGRTHLNLTTETHVFLVITGRPGKSNGV